MPPVGVLQAIRSSRPQRDLFHLISRTNNGHHPALRNPNTRNPKWVHPRDRIKWWNVLPGDKVRLITGTKEYKQKDKLEVIEVDREKNLVYLKGGPQHATGVPNPLNEPDMPKFTYTPMPVHVSNVQVYIGDFEFPPLPSPSSASPDSTSPTSSADSPTSSSDPTSPESNSSDPTSPDQTTTEPAAPLPPRILPVYATRIQHTTPKWDSRYGHYHFFRFAAQTSPRLPVRLNRKGKKAKIEIPWPHYEPQLPSEPTLQDTSPEEALRITWVPPSPSLVPGYHPRGTPTPEDLYLQTLRTTQTSDPSAPLEHHIVKELTGGFHSRSEAQKRWANRKEAREKKLKLWVEKERKESELYADGRSMKEIRLEAAYKFEQHRQLQKSKSKRRQLMQTPKGVKIERKRKRHARLKREGRGLKRINATTLRRARNQVIPEGVNVVEEVGWASEQGKRRIRGQVKKMARLRTGRLMNN